MIKECQENDIQAITEYYNSGKYLTSTCLDAVCAHGHLELVDLLLERQIWSKEELNSAFIFASSCRVKTVQKLIRHGADIHALDGVALERACQAHADYMIEAFIELGINGLEICALHGYKECFELICDYGCDPRPFVDHLLDLSTQTPENPVTELLNKYLE